MLVLLVISRGLAHADFGEQIDGEVVPDLVGVVGPPTELAAVPPHAADQLATIERALREARHPRVRANLVLVGADLLAARGIAGDPAALLAARSAYLGLLCDPERPPAIDCSANPDLEGWPNLDDAVDHFAFVLAFERRRDEAHVLYQRLLADHPDSPFAATARAAIGDFDLDHGRPAPALDAFDAVARDPATPRGLRAFALFGRGSALIRLSREDEAFTSFSAALALDPTPVLADKLREGLVTAFAGSGDPAAAYAAFARAVPDRALALLAELADFWRQDGDSRDARAVYGELLRRMPHDPRACVWQAELAFIALDFNQPVQLLVEAERLGRTLRRARHVLDAERVERCERAMLTITLGRARELAGSYFPDDKLVATHLYELFLHTFPDHPHAPAAARERAALRMR